MNLTDKLLANLPGGDRQDKQAVIICLLFPSGKLQEHKALEAVWDLGDILRTVSESAGVGLYQGYTFGEEEDEEGVAFLITGSDASSIYKEIRPIILSLPTLPVSAIIRRYSQNSDDSLPLGS